MSGSSLLKSLSASDGLFFIWNCPKLPRSCEYEEKADKLNKAAEKINRQGMRTGFHNHQAEFANTRRAVDL
jgi:hypothetical protein